MKLGNFEVRVPDGRDTGDGYISLEHGTKYKLQLINHSNDPCDATLTIDGKDMGSFRVGRHQHIELERPLSEASHFTFYADQSWEGKQAGSGGVARSNKGLVSVRFQPGYVPAPVVKERKDHGRPRGSSCGQHTNTTKGVHGCDSTVTDFDESESMGFCSAGAPRNLSAAGITGLSGHSDQSFDSTAPLSYYAGQDVTINVRLVVSNDIPRELRPNGRSTPVPDPV